MVQYQSGGLTEKELILRQVETPAECTTIADALKFRGFADIEQRTCRYNSAHTDLSFRVSLARSTPQVDSTPTSRSISIYVWTAPDCRV